MRSLPALPLLLLVAALGHADAETTPIGQPIQFSHKQHAEAAHMKCNDCHKLAQSGEVLSMPAGKSCMVCHAEIAKDSQSIKDLKAYVDENEAVPWIRVYEIPGFVEFSHKNHLNAGVTCQTCHGPVAARNKLWRETDLSMGGCFSCHRTHGASTNCSTCHNLEN